MPADPLDGLAASLAHARHALARIAEQHHEAERDFGFVAVSEARLQHVLQGQRAHLDATRAEIERARDLALRAAEQARVDGVDDGPYLQTVAGLERQTDVVLAAVRQLGEVDVVSQLNVERARELLRDNQTRLDASLREQLALLTRLEHLERQHRIARRYE